MINHVHFLRHLFKKWQKDPHALLPPRPHPPALRHAGASLDGLLNDVGLVPARPSLNDWRLVFFLIKRDSSVPSGLESGTCSDRA